MPWLRHSLPTQLSLRLGNKSGEYVVGVMVMLSLRLGNKSLYRDSAQQAMIIPLPLALPVPLAPVGLQADIFLLDDPLSAVDAHVGRHLVDHLLLGVPVHHYGYNPLVTSTHPNSYLTALLTATYPHAYLESCPS